MKGTLGNKTRTIECVSCGLTVTRRMPPGRKYCSLTCYRTNSRPTRLTGAEKQCFVCGNSFYLQRHRRSSTGYFFCSTEHANEWQARNRDAFTCKSCGDAFTRSPSLKIIGKPTYCSLACRDADPERTDNLRRMNAEQATLRPNKLEQLGYAILDATGVQYLKQELIGGRFCVDAFVPSIETVIQFDGDYWHGNPARYPTPDARQARRIKLDASQDAYMRACGYRVLRIWESDMRKRTDHVRSLLSQTMAPDRLPAGPVLL